MNDKNMTGAIVRRLRLVFFLTGMLPFLVAACTPPTSAAFETICRDKLVSAAKAEADYKTKQGKCGMFGDLQGAGLIESGKTLDTIAPGYQWDIFLNEDSSGFTIVAVPSQDLALKPYLIDSGQALMVLTPADIKDPGRSWKAIMETESVRYDEDHHYAYPEIMEYRDVNFGLDLRLSDQGVSYVLTNPRGVEAAAPVSNIGTEFIYLSSTEKFYEMAPVR
jgi:hypothetical protein